MAEHGTPAAPPGLARRLQGLQGLLARYDRTLMRPPTLHAEGAPRPDATRHPLGAALLDWCHAPGSGLREAWLQGQGATALADALALHLDGSLRLQACGGPAARLALRLGVKCDDLALALGRAPRRSDCWDAGWLGDPSAADTQVPRWRPRRPTLLLAHHPAPTPAARAAPAPRPHGLPAVRLLWVHDSTAPLAWRPLDAAPAQDSRRPPAPSTASSTNWDAT